MKLEAQDKRIKQEQLKEKRRLVKLQHEMGETDKECKELTNRIKVLMSKLFPHLTGFYSISSTSHVRKIDILSMTEIYIY